MNADDLARFLRANPQFFDQNPELLETIHVPHPYGGRAIPLAERQTVALREKAKQLEGKLAELIKFGEENDAISEKVHRLAVALVGARDFPALARSLYFHLREDFAVPHVVLRVWGKAVPADFEEALEVDAKQREHASLMAAPQCGPAQGNLFTAWFRDAADHIRSIALVPLGQTAVFGLLALGSEDPQRFYPEMGTLYLRRIGELTAAGVTARL
ncbi:MAG TPA: DUF484 family protein [Burkholderiales bacterium]|nr:DUF484 family protein [Burkholderiales bacterium]